MDDVQKGILIWTTAITFLVVLCVCIKMKKPTESLLTALVTLFFLLEVICTVYGKCAADSTVLGNLKRYFGNGYTMVIIGMFLGDSITMSHKICQIIVFEVMSVFLELSHNEPLEEFVKTIVQYLALSAYLIHLKGIDCILTSANIVTGLYLQLIGTLYFAAFYEYSPVYSPFVYISIKNMLVLVIYTSSALRTDAFSSSRKESEADEIQLSETEYQTDHENLIRHRSCNKCYDCLLKGREGRITSYIRRRVYPYTYREQSGE